MAQPKSFQQVLQELWDLLKTYAQQETVGPLKNLGAQLKWGLIGSAFVTLGVFLLTMFSLRVLQTQVPFIRDSGTWTWIPYLVATFVLAGFMTWIGLKMRKAFDSIEPERTSELDPVGD